MRPDITKSRKVGGRHNEVAHVATASGLGARRQCHHGVSGLFVTQKRLFFVDGRIAKRPLCAARMERAS
jgi:hypothetical protein